MTLRVAVSAGHGPETAGKRAPDGFREFSFTYPTAEYICQYLLEYENVQILKVYDKKSDMPLATRTNKANAWGADLYQSIHGNAYGSNWNDAHGIETWVYSTTSGKNNGYDIAKIVQAKLIAATGLTNRGVKAGPELWEMRKTNMPALLCECGFYTNQREKALMASPGYQQTCARAIVEGIAQYFGLKKKMNVPTATAPVPSTPAKAPTSSSTLYRVQIGAFSVLKNAEALAKTAKDRGFSAFIRKEGNLYKVQIGAFSQKANAEKFLKTAKEKGFKDAYIAK